MKLFLITLLMSSASVYAQSPQYMCDAQRDFQLNETCETRKGFEFVRVEKGWKDKKRGKTWFDEMSLEINQYEAVTTCNNKGQSLPTGWPELLNGKTFQISENDKSAYLDSGYIVGATKNGYVQITVPNYDSDFVAAEKHGIREVFKDMKDRWLWSTSLHPYSYKYAYFFGSSNNAYIYYDYRDEPNSSARCVSR